MYSWTRISKKWTWGLNEDFASVSQMIEWADFMCIVGQEYQRNEPEGWMKTLQVCHEWQSGQAVES